MNDSRTLQHLPSLIAIFAMVASAQSPAPASFVKTGTSPALGDTAKRLMTLPPVDWIPNLPSPVVPSMLGAHVPLANLLVKPGLSAPTTGTLAVDSDVNLAVGPTNVFQWADFRLQVFDKQINPIGNAVAGNLFWSSQSPCSVAVGADGLVQYDKLAKRWLVAMRTGLHDECIGVSSTADVNGTYHQYLIAYADPSNPGLQMDYPKIGLWPDAYYLTFDMIDPSNKYLAQYAVVCALDRKAMIAGSANPAAVCKKTAHNNNTGFFHLLPSDLDSAQLPPAGAPNYQVTFAKPNGQAQYHLYLYKFHVDFTTPGNSTLAGPIQLDTKAFANYEPACKAGGVNCIPQPPPAVPPKNTLDSVGGYMMYRFAYRNYTTHESLLVTQAVQASATGPVGVRWYEIRSPNASPSIYQSGFFAPDTFHRWMSSAAMDKVGNMAVGYSIAGNPGTSYYSGIPGIALTGRTVGDPLNTLRTETIAFKGIGVELARGRWGAVSSMSVDPADQCTLWYTNQYLPTNGVNNWSTQIISFKFTDCN
jgi:hypothetical protein